MVSSNWRRPEQDGEDGVLVEAKEAKGGNEMVYGYGRGLGRGAGRRGGGGAGFGFRGASPPWPYVGRGRGGLPRCGYFLGSAGAPPLGGYQQPYYAGAPFTPEPAPFSPPMSGEEELNFLQSQAEAIKGQLGEIENRIGEIEK